MRTTLDIDDDLLDYVKGKAKVQNTSAGRVVSDMLREKLNSAPVEYPRGYPVIPRRAKGPLITPEYIQRLLDESE